MNVKDCNSEVSELLQSALHPDAAGGWIAKLPRDRALAIQTSLDRIGIGQSACCDC